MLFNYLAGDFIREESYVRDVIESDTAENEQTNSWWSSRVDRGLRPGDRPFSSVSLSPDNHFVITAMAKKLMVMSINEEEDTKIVAILTCRSLQSQCSTRQISWSNDRKRVLILDGKGHDLFFLVDLEILGILMKTLRFFYICVHLIF